MARESTRTRRSSSSEEEKPARRSRASKEEAAPEKPARRSRRSGSAEEPVEEVEVTRKPRSRRGAEAEEVKQAFFDPLAGIDDVLDDIERNVGISEATLDPSEKRMSTGMLMQDVILGGGITAGWYTNFGQEQTCKTTDAVSVMGSSLSYPVPVRAFFDYEGCLTGETQVEVNGKKTTFRELADKYKVTEESDAHLSKEGLYIRTPYGISLMTYMCSKGVKPITKVSTEDGKEIRGYSHPVFVLEGDKIVVKKHEDLRPGDRLLVPA